MATLEIEYFPALLSGQEPTGAQELNAGLCVTSIRGPFESASDMNSWKILPDAEFNEVAASIIINPQLGIAQLKNACIKRERDGWTLLHLFAGGENCEELVAYLLQAGIPVDTTDKVGWTPLLEAAQEGQVRNCELLLSKGATPDLACAVGTTPLKAAIMADNDDLAQWLLEQPGTWSNHWDNSLFELLMKRTPGIAFSFLDKFAIERGHARGGKTAVKYCDLRLIYGKSTIPVHQTALGIAVENHQTHIVLSHRVFKYIMKAKWETFGRTMFIKEVIAFCGLLSSYYSTTIWADPDWIHFHSGFDYWVVVSRGEAWICCLYLLVIVEYREFRGCVGWSYIKSFWNWIEVIAYMTIIATIPLEFIGASTAESRNSLLALIAVALWVNMLQYLQISEKTGLLIAMMSRMMRDVLQFFIIYAVFVLGFSGGFYLLFRGETGFDNFINSFFTVFLMLFGQVTYDPFGGSSGWTWHMSHLLLFVYLIGVVIMLLNILIAMMAATYSIISDSAEDRSWLGYAKLILRMESSRSFKSRQRQFDRLLKQGEVSCPVAQSEGHGATVIDVNNALEGHESKHMKLEQMNNIAARIKSMSDKANEVADASLVELVESDPPVLATRKPQLSSVHLASLKNLILHKSAFNLDEQIDLYNTKLLGLLEDGVRYEEPSKKPSGQALSTLSDSDPATQLLQAVKDVPLQILELTEKIQKLETKLDQVTKALEEQQTQALILKYTFDAVYFWQIDLWFVPVHSSFEFETEKPMVDHTLVDMWEIVLDAEFDETAARIIINPQRGIAKLKNACIKRERDGWTLLHLFAGGENCEELVGYLISAGIPVDTTDHVGWTPLLEAAQEGRISNCELLLAKGATPDLSADGTTPLTAAITSSNAEMVKWLLDQHGTWSNRWDNELFALLMKNTPDVASVFLDKFAIESGHARGGKTAVKYCDLRFIYGEPGVAVDNTALAIAVHHHKSHIVLSHRMFKYIMKVKWETFARTMFYKEVAAFSGLLGSYYVTTIWSDPNWVDFNSSFDYWVAISRFFAWTCCSYLLFEVEMREFKGSVNWSYVKSFWNWVELISYLTILATIPLEFIGASTNASRNSLLALVLVTLWINMLQYLQISERAGLLIAMMSRMVRDIVQFFILYAVFVLGFSGALYLLFRGATGYENFVNSFITVFLMLFGQLTYDPFGNASGWTWHMSNLLLFVYLVGVVIMLLNILIAMMATTYSMISDSAEDRIWLCYAKTILRMESSLTTGVREKQFATLVADETKAVVPTAVKRESLGQGAAVLDVTDAHGTLERKRSQLERTNSLALKIKLLTDKAKQPNDGSPTKLDPPASFKVRGPPLTTMNLTALKQSLLRKSAFDFDEHLDTSQSQQLRLLEDGVRYENPAKQPLAQASFPQQQGLDASAQLLELVKAIPQQIHSLQQKIEALEAHRDRTPNLG